MLLKDHEIEKCKKNIEILKDKICECRVLLDFYQKRLDYTLEAKKTNKK